MERHDREEMSWYQLPRGGGGDRGAHGGLPDRRTLCRTVGWSWMVKKRNPEKKIWRHPSGWLYIRIRTPILVLSSAVIRVEACPVPLLVVDVPEPFDEHIQSMPETLECKQPQFFKLYQQRRPLSCAVLADQESFGRVSHSRRFAMRGDMIGSKPRQFEVASLRRANSISFVPSGR